MNEHFDQKACEQEEKTKIGFFKSHKKALYSAAISVVLILCLVFASVYYFLPAYRYSKALDLIEAGEYNEAYDTLLSCGSFKDSEELLKSFKTVYQKENHTETIDGETTASTTEYQYDEDGNVLLKITHYENGFFRKTEYEYDKNGNQTLISSHTKNGFVQKTAFEFDENGNKIREIQYDSSDHIKSETQYFADGKQKLKLAYYADGAVKSKDEYNQNGNIIFSATYTSDGSIVEKKEYAKDGRLTLSVCNIEGQAYRVENRYDEKGHQTLHYDVDNDGNEYRREFENKYDEKGNLLSIIRRDDGEFVGETKIQYDDQGNVIRREEQFFGEKDVTTFEYDQNGNKTLYQSISYDRQGKISYESRDEYEYDKNGRMIRKLAFHNEIETVTEYEHDENGNQILCTVTNALGKTIYKYDDKGNRVFTLKLNQVGSLNEKTLYFYNENGDETFAYCQTGNGTVVWKRKTRFDAYGTVFYEHYSGPETQGTCNITTHDVARTSEYSNPKYIYIPQ